MNLTTVRSIFKNTENYIDKKISIGGWIRSNRASKNFGFLVVSDGTFFNTLQIVYHDSMENFAEISKLNVGAAVIVDGTLIATPDAKQPFELQADSVFVEGKSDSDYPMQKKRHSFEYLRTVSHLRPRTNTFQAVFRVRSLIAHAIHTFFQERNFVYVHTPLITGSDCEGAGEMFQVTTMDLNNIPKTANGKVDFSQDFFGKPTNLTVSGQLNGETFAMAFRNIYTFGPTFRAENSNTTRHAAEFWMIEPEVAFADLNDNMQLAEDMLKFVISYVLEKAPEEMEFFNSFIDKGLLDRLHNVLENDFGHVTYTEAIEILEKNNDNFDYKVYWGCDLQTEHERYLTEQVFKRPVFVTDYPKEIKAFYMKQNDDGKTVAAMDCLVPGIGEIIGGSQREDSLRVNMQDFEIAPLMGFASRMGYNVTGLANGGASMQAVLNRGELDADISINQMKVNDTDVAPLEILSKWDFVQQRVRVNVRNGSTGKNIVTGYYAPETKRYYAEGEFDNIPLLMLDPVLSGVVTQTEGMAYAKVDIMGQGRQAKLNGTIDVEDLATTIDFTRARYSVPRAKVNIVDNHLIATSARVYDEERNTAQLNMDLSLEHLSNIAYNMRVTPRNMIVLNTTAQDNDLFYGKVYASGVATINGSKQGTTLDIVGTTGDNSKFYMPLSSKSDASQADFVTFEQPGMHIDTTNYLSRKKMMYERRNRRAASSASNMNINISLTATDDAEVQLVIDPTVGDIIKARGNGTLSMRIVPSANIFDMYGDYTITDGSYLFTLQNIINKLFLIESGSTITWTGDPVDARLNIDAIYKLKTSLQPLLSSTTLDNVTRAVPVECIINLTERLSNPTVTFDVRVPNADSEIQNAVANLLNNQQSIATQFMYLLVSGSFYSDSSTSANIGASASATTGFELLSNQVSNWLSSDDYNIILRYRPKSELTSDEIDVGFSKSLVNDRLLVEVEGNYLVDNKMAQSSNMSNFMGEAYITWLIDKAGYLKLKGFTQTIDRFDENQGLQETGVGIYYKEDFDNWTDLKRRVRDRFMSKRRREREAAEREAKAAQQQTDSLNRSNGVQSEAVTNENTDDKK